MSDTTDSEILRSPLDGRHRALGARMLPFAGWEMPIQYDGIVAEHTAVREKLGVFDISHMGQVWVKGDGAVTWLNGLLTNDISALAVSEGQYTLMLNENGGVIDDLIAYRATETDFFLVVNAAKRTEDVAWLTKHLTDGISIDDVSDHYGAIAVQGPDTLNAWGKVGGHLGELPERNGIAEYDGVIVCCTGYTGEDGFELFATADTISQWWDQFIEAGAKPCGLGARDTLRLEKCYPLNGSDLSPELSPLEAGLGFFVKLGKGCGFTGGDVLAKQKTDGLTQRLAAIEIVGKAPPPRHGYSVVDPLTGEIISELSSGGLSPTLGKGIALAYLPTPFTKVGTALEIDVRGRKFPAVVVKKPFV